MWYYALSGLVNILAYIPRALPWAVEFRSCGAGSRRLAILLSRSDCFFKDDKDLTKIHGSLGDQKASAKTNVLVTLLFQ